MGGAAGSVMEDAELVWGCTGLFLSLVETRLQLPG